MQKTKNEGDQLMRTKDEFNEQKQRQQLLNAAWKLFYEKGYQDTTLDDILKEAHCSKGRFYYYFHAKAELLDSMYELFDEKYEEFYQSIDPTLGSFEQLLSLNRFMFDFMSRQIGKELLTSLYVSQLSGTTGIRFWGEQRSFIKIILKIVTQGQERGEIRKDIDRHTLASDIVAEERSQLISWCLAGGSYDLAAVSIPKLERSYIGYSSQYEAIKKQ
ncbi:TetR/AcrR family transcriptional regulator [Clostridium sp. AF32-12BH]|nr:TetR/AcrR family transcriptional regulator [Clostridium sp. AF32-12BH]